MQGTEAGPDIARGVELAAGSSAIEVAVVGVGEVVGSWGSGRGNSATGWTQMGVVLDVVAESQPWDWGRHVGVAAAAREQVVGMNCCRRERRDIEFVRSSRRPEELVE